MNHLLILPVALPALVAALTVLAMRRRLAVARILSLLSGLALIAAAAALVVQSDSGLIQSYAVGDWPAPFGIVLVLDRLSAMMLLLTAVLALAVLGHALATGLDRRGWHFHPLFHFLLLGLNGAFLTGDLFNLFVFFEVLLIASYGLMLHGMGAARLRAGLHYVIVNLVGSTLFLVAVGTLYGLTGTLNMADMAMRVAAAPAGDQGLLRAAAQLLTLVFALKAAILPLHLWLPGTYSLTSAPVAAMFAIMTKVGVYAIIRVTALVFGADAGAAAFAPAGWLLPGALLTAAIGFIALLASQRLQQLAAFALLGSTGTLMVAVALFEPKAMTAALYYLPHTTLAAAALFLTCDLIARRRGVIRDALVPGKPFADQEALSALFFLAAIALVGLPPLSGFVGKLLILDATRTDPAAAWIWAVLLGTTFLGLIAFGRAGSALFWKRSEGETPPAASILSYLPTAGLIGLLAALTLWAGPTTRYAGDMAAQVFDRQAMVQAVLGER